MERETVEEKRTYGLDLELVIMTFFKWNRSPGALAYSAPLWPGDLRK